MDIAQLHWIWLETSQKLESYRRRVQEGRDIDAAVEFAKFVFWSGIPKLMEANPHPAPLLVDGALLRSKAQELIELCNERYRTRNLDPMLSAKEFKSLHEKIDLLAGYVSQLVPSLGIQVKHSAPELKIINGGSGS